LVHVRGGQEIVHIHGDHDQAEQQRERAHDQDEAGLCVHWRDDSRNGRDAKSCAPPPRSAIVGFILGLFGIIAFALFLLSLRRRFKLD
jgi:hypothetical protein